jgi:hypothetical protein
MNNFFKLNQVKIKMKIDVEDLEREQNILYEMRVFCIYNKECHIPTCDGCGMYKEEH